MSSRVTDLRLRPLSGDSPSALTLLAEAITEASRRAVPPQDPTDRIARASALLRNGELEGRILELESEPVGLAVWDSSHPAGLHLETLYLRPAVATPPRYEACLDLIEAAGGAAALVVGGWAGLDPEAERAVMDRRDFAPFARSEMRFPPGAPLPPIPRLAGFRVRPLRASDEAVVARLHGLAFAPTFDFYLFQADVDPVKDSALAVRDMLSARYGEWIDWASFLVETEGGVPCGASVFVRAPYGPLLVSVHVDPAYQGARLGEALVVTSLHALRERHETVIALNVTEGNRRAIALYERLGFVRTIGPEYAWYSRARVPAAPDGSANRPPSRSTTEPPGG